MDSMELLLNIGAAFIAAAGGSGDGFEGTLPTGDHRVAWVRPHGLTMVDRSGQPPCDGR